MKQEQFPPGWDAERVQRVLAHYEDQTEEEAVAEDEAAFVDQTQAMMEIPLELVPVVRELLAKYYGDNRIPA
jgi:enoyl reductase-like protein